MFSVRIKSILIALLAGAMLPLAFAPFGIYTVAVIAVAVLLYLWQKDTPVQAALHGFCFGLGFFSFGVYWIYISIHVYGNSSVALATLITGLFIGFLALFPALQGYLQNKFFKNNLLRLLVVTPLLWVLLELLRTWIFSGFPWLMLGYSQIDAPLRGLAPIIGVYGISLAVVYTAAVFVSLYTIQNSYTKIILLSSIIVLWFGSSLLAKVHWTQQNTADIKVSLVQGNVAQEVKWQSRNLDAILQGYYALTQQNLHSDIVVWPEAAIPDWRDQQQKYLRKVDALTKKQGITLITGVPIATAPDKYYNGIIALGASHGEYLKKHLVPFGEYIPLKAVFDGLLHWFSLPMSDFTPGPAKQADLSAKNIILAPFLCYEIGYIDLLADYLPRAQLLLTISDDSWFGKSIALAQHLEIARMRSLESGRYQMVVANTGFTAIIDEQGKLVAQAPPFQQFVLTGKVYAFTGATPWVYVLKLFR